MVTKIFWLNSPKASAKGCQYSISVHIFIYLLQITCLQIFKPLEHLSCDHSREITNLNVCSSWKFLLQSKRWVLVSNTCLAAWLEGCWPQSGKPLQRNSKGPSWRESQRRCGPKLRLLVRCLLLVFRTVLGLYSLRSCAEWRRSTASDQFSGWNSRETLSTHETVMLQALLLSFHLKVRTIEFHFGNSYLADEWFQTRHREQIPDYRDQK